ncbi:phospholipid carrier-dependent glycosyltransferase [Candidatus Woesearchaeota archaeon]|nr:phospholipid carrier-dependent glycosyltransferase [Candidatus Woesearchaeota archaeon]
MNTRLPAWLQPRPGLLWLCLILITLTGYRFLALSQADLQLYFDEAYYWGWSLQPAFGYYSKPPMIAWSIRLATGLCGTGELCIHSLPLLWYALTTLILYGIGHTLFSRTVGFVSALVFVTLPLISFYSWLTTTDGLLLLFWSLGLYGFSRAVDSNAWRDWLLMGLALGLGLLSKYTASLFLVSVGLVLVMLPRYRMHLLNPRLGIALLLALLIFSPNLIWNGQMQFASFRHTAEIAHWDKRLFHPDHLLAFLGVQVLLLGPVLCLVLWRGLRRVEALFWRAERVQLIIWFTLPVLLLYALQALIARANYNWAMAAYVAASLLVGLVLVQLPGKRTVTLVLLSNLGLGSLVYHYGEGLQYLGIPLSRKTDIYHSMKGWRELAAQVQTLRAPYPGAALLGDNRRTLAELNYYLSPRPASVAIWNPDAKLTDHYRLTADLRQSRQTAFVMVADETPEAVLRGCFKTVIPLGTARVQVHADYVMEHPVYYLEGFGGYSP